MLISVIIPTYNRAHLIKESIQSVLDQTIPPLEVIVVDDHSTDNTKEIIKLMAMDNGTIKYVLNQRKKGANGSRNTGIKLAKGDYIAFQDSDDIWMKNKLEKQIEFISESSYADICFCSLELNSSRSIKEIIPNNEVQSKDIYKKLLEENFISTQTILIKKEIVSKYLFDETLSRFQDWDFSIRVAKDNTIIHLPLPLVQVNTQNDSISTLVNEEKSIYELFNKHPQLKYSTYANKSMYNKSLYKFKKKGKVVSVYYLAKYIIYKLLYIAFKK